MWEVNISAGSGYADSLKNLEGRIRPYVTPGKGIMLTDTYKDRAYISIACERGLKNAVIAELNHAVSDIITVDFKYHYLQKHSKLPKGNKINYNAFMRALVAFDREWDKELVLKNLNFKNELLLDGFFNFRLKELKAKWQEVCDLASKNSGYLDYHDTFVELLTFLIKTIDVKAEQVFVLKAGDNYDFYDADSKLLDRYKLGIDENIKDETLLPNLINLAPKEVFVLNGGIPEYIFNLMSCVFKVNSKIN